MRRTLSWLTDYYNLDGGRQPRRVRTMCHQPACAGALAHRLQPSVTYGHVDFPERVDGVLGERWSRATAIAVACALFFSGALFLVKTPHLSLAVNSACVVGFLVVAYWYVRNQFALRIPLALLLLVFVALQVDALGNFFHLYGTMVGPIRYDELAHLLVQALGTPIVIWIAQAWSERAELHLPSGLTAFCAASAMFSLSAFYEVLELWDELVFGGQRIWSLHDTSEDLQWDLCGIVLGVILAKLLRNTRSHGGSVAA